MMPKCSRCNQAVRKVYVVLTRHRTMWRLVKDESSCIDCLKPGERVVQDIVNPKGDF